MAAISPVGQHVVLLERTAARRAAAGARCGRRRTPRGRRRSRRRRSCPSSARCESRRGGQVQAEARRRTRRRGPSRWSSRTSSPDGVHVFDGTCGVPDGAGRLPPHGRGAARRGRVAGGGERVLPGRHARRLARARPNGDDREPLALRRASPPPGTERSFARQDGWRIGDRGPRPVPGSQPCVRTRRALADDDRRARRAGPAPGRDARRAPGSRARRRAAATAARRTTTRPRRRSAPRRAPRGARGGRAPRPPRARTPKPHGITTTTSGCAAAISSQLAVRDFSPGRPSGSTPPAISISCGIQWPPTYGGASHSSAATVRGGAPSSRARTASIRSAASSSSSSAAPSSSVASASRRTSLSTSPSVIGSSEITCGLRRDLLRDRAHVVERDRADLAQRLGDDQVRLELVQLLRVELVEVLAALRALAHGGVDLLRREPLRDDRARQMWQLGRLWRIIALVGDPDDVGAESEREQRLGSGGNEACNAHE